MSGGVDSSVSAALLQRAGYDVTGVFIRVWQPDWIECNWREERLETMRAAAHLGIPFVTLDLEREYKEGVIDYMIREYASGRTPNPDVMCNREVKFGAFWRWAQEQGADYIATGHYAQNEIGADGAHRMLTSKDLNKDQTYFLWTLTSADLEHVLFPVGAMTKDEVRAAALRFRLPNANKKDSQGLCFMGKVDVKEFLRHYVKAEEGNVLDESGAVIGTHPGALLYTIGERHGFTVTKKTPNDAPYYVVAKDVGANTLTVSNRSGLSSSRPPACTHTDSKTALLEESGSENDRCPQAGNSIALIEKANWVSAAPKAGEYLQARSRYREPLQAVVMSSSQPNGSATITFKEPQQTLAPGQSLVLYQDGECLGGGIIAEAIQ